MRIDIRTSGLQLIDFMIFGVFFVLAEFSFHLSISDLYELYSSEVVAVSCIFVSIEFHLCGFCATVWAEPK